MAAASSRTATAAEPGASSRKRSLSDTGFAEETLYLSKERLVGFHALHLITPPARDFHSSG